ncbi:MAG: alpha/beta hydrolase, partial [Sphingomonadales bacterium]
MRTGAIAAVTMLAMTLPGVARQEQILPGGARWSAEIPANWNGTLLLYS